MEQHAVTRATWCDLGSERVAKCCGKKGLSMAMLQRLARNVGDASAAKKRHPVAQQDALDGVIDV